MNLYRCHSVSWSIYFQYPRLDRRLVHLIDELTSGSVFSVFHGFFCHPSFKRNTVTKRCRTGSTRITVEICMVALISVEYKYFRTINHVSTELQLTSLEAPDVLCFTSLLPLAKMKGNEIMHVNTSCTYCPLDNCFSNM
ncbi:hypothetical protein CRM22_001428 [Opisthorchis felineus]|uniref:Uncharacterized protein n=1 Tax=Opisthorchis felineus TaxID=147828 RepID=A0A4V3SGT4_OPIFE|nr:hypothetical protein CRM22_001428 [Opisthorchis felineus]